jgi:hypothetical protein
MVCFSFCYSHIAILIPKQARVDLLFLMTSPLLTGTNSAMLPDTNGQRLKRSQTSCKYHLNLSLAGERIDRQN